MKICNVTKNYGNFKLNVNKFETKTGEIHGLIGSNGCGKTTAMKIMAGLIKPDSGTIDYEGLSPRDITMITRKPYMLRDTVVNNLIYPLKLRNIKPDRAMIDHHLDIAGLQDCRSLNALGLSSGQQQRLALVRSMIFSPKLILVDEAFSNMDVESLAFFEGYILDNFQHKQITWLIISHQLSIIKRMCSYVYFMHEGTVRYEGLTVDLLDNPQDDVLKKYLRYN